MPDVKTTQPAASFLSQLLDNRPSGAPQSAEVTAPARTISRVYPGGSQSSYGQADAGGPDISGGKR